MKVFLRCLYFLVAVSPVALAFAFDSRPDISSMWGLGRVAGLLGFSLLVLQVALGSRLKGADRAFGLDAVVAFHKKMAAVCGLLILAHPMLLAVGMGSTYLFTLDAGWKVNLGQVAFLLLFVTILSALLFRVVGMDYNIWRFFHKGAILVVVVGFVHGLVIGSDLQTAGMRVYWWVLLALAVGLFAYSNFFRPLFVRYRFRVAGVQKETHNTWTLTLAPEKEDELFSYLPGQFGFLKLVRSEGRSEEHPFTISSSPTHKGHVSVTIKEVGNFTRTIGKTRKGDRSLLDAPFGRFSFKFHDPDSFLFIAGGVGITPIMSMLRYLRDTNDKRPVTLICGNRLEDDVIFREEIGRLPSHIKVTHVLSEAPPDWKGASGYITEEVIARYAGDVVDKADVYLCGPPPMMKGVIKALKSLGVGSNQVHYERFAL